MALNNLGLGIVFTAQDLASSVIRGVNRNFVSLTAASNTLAQTFSGTLGIQVQSLTGSLKNLGAGIAGITAGMIGLRTAFGLAEPAGEFEFKLAGIQAITGATATQMKALEESALAAGIATQFSPLQAAEGLQILAQAGFGAEGSIKALNPVLDLAAASLGQLSLQKAGGLAVASIKTFSEAAEDNTLAMDNLVRATARSSLQFRELPLALGIASRGAKTFNASMEDTLIALGEVRNVIPTIERGATAVAVAMERLSNVKTINTLQNELGVVVEQGGKFRPFLDVIGDLTQRFQNLTEVERANRVEALFGNRARAGIVVLMDQISKRAAEAGGGVRGFTNAITNMRMEMRNAEITARGFRDTLNATFKGARILLQGTLETIDVTLGKSFAMALTPFVETVTSGLNFILRMFLQIPEPVRKAGAEFFVFFSVGALITGVVFALKGLLVILPAILAVAAPIVAPFLAAAKAIALVVAGIMLLREVYRNNLGGLADAINPVIEGISLAVRGLAQLMTKGEIVGKVAERLALPANSMILDFLEGFTRVFAVVRSIVTGVLGALFGAVRRIFGSLQPAFMSIGRSLLRIGRILVDIGKIVGTALGFKQTEQGIDSLEQLAFVLTTVVFAPIEAFLRFIGTIVSAVALTIEGVILAIESLASPLMNLADVVGGVFNSVLGLLTGNFDAFFQGVAQGINGLIRIMNSLIRTARDVTLMITPRSANRKIETTFNRFLVDEVSAPQVAFALGESTSEVQRLAAQELAGLDEAGPGRMAAGPVGAAGTNATALPRSTPGQASSGGGGGGLTAADAAMLIEAAIERGVASQDARPIVVQSKVMVDGQQLAEVQSQQERDRRSRVGRFSGSLRDE